MKNKVTTPQVASIFKTIATPVSTYTGQPDLSIPLYVISEGEISLPLMLVFNTSGIYVDEEASSVGTGVKINVGGSIVRSPNGRPDERGFFHEVYQMSGLNTGILKDYGNTPSNFEICYPYCGIPNSITEYIRRAQFYSGVNSYNDPYSSLGNSNYGTDLRPDDFYYSFGIKSGLFRFNQSTREFLTYPLDNINIQKTVENSRIRNFLVTDDLGIKYSFGEGAVESSRSTQSSSPVLDQGWFLSQITDLKNNRIDFEYIENSYDKFVKGKTEYYKPSSPTTFSFNESPERTFEISEKLIKKISFRGGFIDFIYVNDRIDIAKSRSSLNNNLDKAPRLDRINVFDSNNVLVKSIKLYQSYFLCKPIDNQLVLERDRRLRLDSISVLGESSGTKETFKFSYYGVTDLPNKNSLARDHWGYYNGADDNNTLYPAALFSPIEFGYRNNPIYNSVRGNRYVNEQKAQVFTVNRIVYPSGGSKYFEFESNTVAATTEIDKLSELGNDGFEVVKLEFQSNGSDLATFWPNPGYVNSNNTERIIYFGEFQVSNFYSMPSGEADVELFSNYIKPDVVTSSMLNMWAYNFEVFLERKQSDGSFVRDRSISSMDRSNFEGAYYYGKLSYIGAGTYRIGFKMVSPPPYVMSNWTNISPSLLAHYTQLKLTFRNLASPNVRIGGLRVKSILEEGTNYLVSYDYNLENSLNSSGKVINLPEYIEDVIVRYNSMGGGSSGFMTYKGKRYSSEPVFSLEKTQSSNVGYTHVSEIRKDGSNIQRQVFSYSFVQNANQGFYRQYYKESQPRSWQYGKLLGRKIYDNQRLVSEELYDYYGMVNETDKGYAEEINTSLATYNDGYGYTSSGPAYIRPIYRSVPIGSFPGGVDYQTISLYGVDEHSKVLNTYISPPIKIPYFKIYTGFDKIKSKTTTSFEASGNVTQEEYFYYDNLKHLQPTRIETINSSGRKKILNTIYPFDYGDGTGYIDAMKSANVKSVPIEKVEVIENSGQKYVVNGVISVFKATSLGLLDYSLKTHFHNPVPISTFKFSNQTYGLPPFGSVPTSFENDPSYFKYYEFPLYDYFGNPQEVKTLNLPSTVYLWGYGGQYPIAKIENATYAQVTAALGAGASGLLSALNLPTVSDNTINATVETIRQNLSSSQVSTYTYNPLVGMASMTDPRGIKTEYKYDGFQRLKDVLDFEGNILKNYKYHYRP